MARKTIPLSDKEIKAASPREKAYKLFDGEGLYLEVPFRQRKRWRLKYCFNEKRNYSLWITILMSLLSLQELKERS